MDAPRQKAWLGMTLTDIHVHVGFRKRPGMVIESGPLTLVFFVTAYEDDVSPVNPWGRRTLDELAMCQQVWQPPFLYVPALGGFGVMNFDGEWNDSRQCLFAELFMEYYRETVFLLTDLANTVRDIKVMFQDGSSRMIKLEGKTVLRP